MTVANYTLAEDCWVDVYSERDFRGRMQRLRLDKHGEYGEHDVSNNKIGSMIVGPGAVVLLSCSDQSQGRLLKVNPRKIIADVSKRCGEQPVMKLLIERSQAPVETNGSAFMGSRHVATTRRQR